MTNNPTKEEPVTIALSSGREQLAAAEDRYAAFAAAQRLRPSTGAICPRRVAGVRCHAWHDRPALCVCQRHHHLLDHGRMWLDAHGRHRLTCEPYDAEGEELAAFVADLADIGLRVDISGMSLWNPGWCVLLIVTRDTTTDELAS